MISSMTTIWGVELEGVMSLALRSRGFATAIVELAPNTWVRRFHRLFGNRTFLEFERCWLDAASGALIPDEAVRAFEPGKSQPSVSDLLRVTFRSVDIGRIALSNVLYRHKFTKFDLSQGQMREEVYRELLACQVRVCAAEALVERHAPVIACVLEKGLSPAAEIVGVCLARGVPVIQYVGAQRQNDFALKRYSLANRHQHPFSLDAGTWEDAKRMPWELAHEETLMAELEQSYASGAWFDRKSLQKGKRMMSAEEVRAQLGLDPIKKTAIIFSHVLWDATFFYGEGLFDDYESWLIETVRAACANPRLNWVVKLHPDLVWKLKQEGFTGELRDTLALRMSLGVLPAHVKLVMPDTDISTYSIFGVADYCLTVRGTVGIEMACFGVPVLTGGSGRYSHHGFTVDSASRDEYLGRLQFLERLEPMTAHQRQLARRYAYTLFWLRPWHMESFEVVKAAADAGVSTGPTETQVVPRVTSYAEFAAARDIGRLGEWIESGTVDYVRGVPD
jgi:hypothetical protein